MVELWEAILPIIGAGIVGYVIRLIEEKRRRTHEKEAEYRRELKKHLPDLIEPLFKLLGNLWSSLLGLIDWEISPNKVVRGRELTRNLGEVAESLYNLRKFVKEKETELDLLLPHPLQSWSYARIESHLESIVYDLKHGVANTSDIHEMVGAIIDIQHDLQKIIGFETKIHLESEYAFEKPLSRFERFKQKLRR